jgi:hypothetical protein
VDFGKATLISIVIAPIAVGAWIQGCGPSVQSVYEGNVRFEHCYRLDLDANIAAGHREACWRSYTERYHYGQTKDRIEYARRRIRALASGDTSRPQLDLEHTDAAAQQVSPAEAPLPTSVHAPPPPTARVASKDAGPDSGRGDGGGGPPPEAACSAACWNAWKACGGTTCRTDAGGKVGEACAACDRDYRRCMQRCFQ